MLIILNYGTGINCYIAGWNRVGMNYDTSVSTLQAYVYTPVEGDATSTDSVTAKTPDYYKVGCHTACGGAYVLYSFSFREDLTLGIPSNANIFPNPFDTCGDSTLQTSHLEECDDGGYVNSDGCNEACLLETGSCSATPISCTTAVPTPACGNGAIGSTEACDDGNTGGSDGCDATCNIEPGYTCVNSPAPSVCTVSTVPPVPTPTTPTTSSSACDIESCSQCEANDSSKCNQCNSGYKLASNGKCVTPNVVVLTSYGDSVAKSARYSSISGAVVATVTAILTLKSPTILWSIINQAQIMQLFVLIDGYMPEDAKGMLSGEGGIPIDAGFIPAADVPYVDEFADWVNIKQTEPSLEMIGIESGSSINNSISFMLTLLGYILLHCILFCLPNCKPNDDAQKLRKFYWNTKTSILSLFALSIYIRSFYETYQFLVLSSCSDIWNNEKNEKYLNIGSLVFAIILLLVCVGFFLWSVYHYVKARSGSLRVKKLSREFENGVKEHNSSKLYSPFGLLRRALLCAWMVFASSLGAIIHMAGLFCIQAPYLIYILCVRPLDGHQQNLVECINEIFFTLTAIFLIFFNTETAWNRDLEIAFINCLLANSIIIALIPTSKLIPNPIVASLISLVNWLRKKNEYPEITPVVKPTSQSFKWVKPRPELQLDQNRSYLFKRKQEPPTTKPSYFYRHRSSEESKEELAPQAL